MLRKMKSRLVIIECAGYIFWQFFLREVYFRCNTIPIYNTFLNIFIL